MRREEEIQVRWQEARRTLTLEGEPVLEYTLSWPEVTGAGLGGRWISRYYARLARTWRERWEREIYWRACLELGERRERARPFTPWQGELCGEVTLLEGGLLSLRFTGWEKRGDGRPNRVCWGDAWKVRQGSPCTLKELSGKRRGWSRQLWKELVCQGEERRSRGELFLDEGWQKKARAARPLKSWWLTQDGIEVSLPQGVAAPMAEGCPVFTLERERGADEIRKAAQYRRPSKASDQL